MDVKPFVHGLNNGVYLNPTIGILDVCSKVRGFSAPSLMMVLSTAIKHLGPEEIYLEVGSLHGRTLIGGMIDNAGKKAVAVDNFSGFGGSEKILRANIESFGVQDRITLFPEDSNDFLRTHKEYHRKVGVYFYDGDHNTEAGYQGLIHAVPFFTEKAIVVMDDFSGMGVWRSTVKFLRELSENLTILFAMATTDYPYPHPKWHNGIIVFQWNRNIDNRSIVG